MNRMLLILVFLGTLPQVARPQVFDEEFDHWPLRTHIAGTVAVASDVDGLQSLLPTLTAPQKSVTLFADGVSDETINLCRQAFEQHSFDVHVERSNEDLPNPLRELRQKHPDVFCWLTAQPVGSMSEQRTQKCRDLLREYLEADGVVCVVGPGAAVVGEPDFSAPANADAVAPGPGLWPDCMVRLSKKNSDPLQPGSTSTEPAGFVNVLQTRPRTVGISIQPNTALVLTRRTFRVLGVGQATFVLPPGSGLPLRQQTLQQQQSPRQDPNEYLVDLTEWRRDAIDRTLPPFPIPEVVRPVVDRGTLMIVGGGVLPDGFMEQFVSLAGGPTHAKLVYVPCSEGNDISGPQSVMKTWKSMGVADSTVVHTKDRNRANSDEGFLQPLRNATGIWFGGGRQWNLADSYYGTKAHQLMKEVLHRGGVIGGSSAGASIQAQYLARATPIQNFRIMAPGYERGGLGFIRGVAIDQHFSQRNRLADMSSLVQKYPQLLGIGIDESTALIVTQSLAEVTGQGQVYFYDRRQPTSTDGIDYLSLPAGSTYDLAARKIITDTRKPTPQ